MKRMMKKFAAAIRLTVFFFKESGPFMQGTPRLKYYLYFPVAYAKFMYYSFSGN